MIFVERQIYFIVNVVLMWVSLFSMQDFAFKKKKV